MRENSVKKNREPNNSLHSGKRSQGTRYISMRNVLQKTVSRWYDIPHASAFRSLEALSTGKGIEPDARQEFRKRFGGPWRKFVTEQS